MCESDLLGVVSIDDTQPDFATMELDGVTDITTLPDFQYPAALLYGVKFSDTMRVLNSIRRDSYRMFDVWVDLEDGNTPVKVGTLQMDIETLAALKYLGLKLELYLEGRRKVVDLNDIQTLEAFI